MTSQTLAGRPGTGYSYDCVPIMKYFTPRARTPGVVVLAYPVPLAFACAGLSLSRPRPRSAWRIPRCWRRSQRARPLCLKSSSLPPARSSRCLTWWPCVPSWTAEALERQWRHTAWGDLLARLPGVEMSRNGGPGTTTSLFCVVPNHVLPPCTSMVCAWTRNPPAAPRGNPFRSD